ncbi:MAG: S8 family serine peptidase, partial [Candidatus Lindowbacteria bacterium]|nr:S8 family serine peptidase [Candidatus Lindowbacteria bacterium]
DIWTADGTSTSSYIEFTGSSAAASYVGGIIGLMKSVNPYLTRDQAYNILKTTAKDVQAAGYDKSTGWGLVQADKAVQGAIDTASITGPGNGALIDTPSPTLTWTTGSGSYSVWVGNTITGEVRVNKTITTDTFYHLTAGEALTLGGTYEFWLKNSASDGTDWTKTIFRVFDTKPVNLNPDSGVVYSAHPRISWDTILNATGYRIELGTGSPFVMDTAQVTGNVNSYVWDTDLSASTDSHWFRVIPLGIDSADTSDWASWIVTFWDTKVGLVNPGRMGSSDTITPIFEWDTYQFAHHFAIWMADSKGTVILRDTTTRAGDTSYTLSTDTLTLQLGETYSWAILPDNASVWSITDTFSVGDTDLPTLVRPINGASVDTITPYFLWDSFPLSDTYNFWLADSSNTVIMPVTTIELDTDFQLLPGTTVLGAGLQYQWAVKPISSANWSATETFVIGETTPATLRPANSETTAYTITFTWDTLFANISAGPYPITYDETQYLMEIGGGALSQYETLTITTDTGAHDSTLPGSSSDSYWWRLKPVNSPIAVWGVWHSFKITDTTTSPTLISPLNGAREDSFSITFVWDTILNATSYLIWLGDSQSTQIRQDTLLVSSGVETTFTLTQDTQNLNPGETYTWTVKANNSSYSSSDSFTLGDTGTLALISPINGEYVVDTITPYLRWDSFQFADSYNFWMTDTSGTVIFATTTIEFDTDFQILPGTTTLGPGLQYNWAVSPSSSRNWSATETFVVGETTPLNLLPANSETVSYTINFQWDTVFSQVSTGDTNRTHTFDETQYYLEIGGGALSAYETLTITTDTGGHDSTMPGASADSYFWRLKPVSHPLGIWGPWQSFKITDTTVGPTLISPINEARQDSLNITFQWDSILNATSYIVWLGDSGGTQLRQDTILVSSGVETNFTLMQDTQNLNPGETYIWTVKANNSAYSASETFTLGDTANPPITLISPINGAYVVDTVTPYFRWDTHQFADSYRFWLTDTAGATIFMTSGDTSLSFDTDWQILPGTTTLGPGLQYNWAVTPSSSRFWSTTETFVVGETTALNLFPANSETVSYTISFGWDTVFSQVSTG